MNTGQIYDLFRALIDEPDETFLTTAQAQTMLSMGYREFRQKVSSIDPEIYNERVHITPTGTEHDLAGLLFGSAAGAATSPAQRVIRVGRVDSAASDNLSYYIVPAQTPLQVENMEGDYCISNTKIIFSYNANGGVYRVEYVPESVIASASWVTGGGTFIDTLTGHHPLIAFYAARYYMVRDGAPNNPLTSQLMVKERELETYLTIGRATDGSHYIVPQIGYSKVVTV